MPPFIHDDADFSSWLGLIVSIAGMVLTIFTLVTAQGIKAKLMRRFQLPQMIQDLQDGLTKLSSLLSEPNFNAQSLKEIISRLSVTLEDAHQKTKGAKVAEAMKRARELLEMDPLTPSHGLNFILKMTRAHEELCLEKRDDSWNI